MSKEGSRAKVRRDVEPVKFGTEKKLRSRNAFLCLFFEAPLFTIATSRKESTESIELDDDL